MNYEHDLEDRLLLIHNLPATVNCLIMLMCAQAHAQAEAVKPGLEH